MGIVLALAAARMAAGAPPAPKRAAPAAIEAVSAPRLVAIRPVSGPAAGGTSASVYGLSLLAGSTVTIGGAGATGVTVAGPTRIDVASPALTPGSVNDVVVTVPGSTPVMLRGAWFARFADVPPSFLFARSIEKLRRTGITTGCGGGNYCPGDSVTRAQMAVFILRGKHGSTYHPPPATGLVFHDVPKAALFADWMEEFAAEGITTGCGGGNYCPSKSVTRGEMAVFLLRARLGSTHNPPPPTGFFDDVPVGAPFGKWIEELAGDAITSGCGNGNYCPNSPSTRGEMSVFLTKTFAKSPQELIADDLAAGDIDYETSLLYRLYALFWDPRLPARYQMAPTSGEDAGLFEEIELVFPDLSANGQAAIAPFLARPDDPSSPFGPAPTMRPGRRPNDGSTTQCQTTWVTYPSAHFDLHLCASGDETADDTLAGNVDGVAEGLWAPMTGDMGEPIPDCYTPEGGSEICPGGDGKIDMYLLDEDQCRERNGQCWPISSGAVATTVSAPPEVGNGKSAYMLLGRDRAAAAGQSSEAGNAFKSDFAHEFFHVLQFRHNRKAMAVDTGIVIGGERIIENVWYTEASATWAEWFYVPAAADDQVHDRFADDFQPSHESLLSNYPREHPYAAYIWPFFSQQEEGSGTPVFDAWVAAEPATTPEGITNAVDQQLSFATHFHDFAVRNWNKDLAGHPIPKLYGDLAGSGFPGAGPPTVNSFQISDGDGPATITANIASLAAQYDHIDVDSSVKKLILHFDKLPATIDADLLVMLDSGDWELKPVEDKSQPVVFCRTHDDEKVDEIVVVLSNHDKDPDNFATAQYKVEVKPSCCGELAGVAHWKAHVTANYSLSGQQNPGYEVDFTLSQKFDISGELGTNGYDLNFFSLNDNASGTGTEHDKVVSHVGSTTSTSTQDGDGAIDGASITMTMDFEKCTFTFNTSVELEVNNGYGTFSAHIGGVYANATRSLTGFTDKISGGMSFPAHSYDWIYANPDQDAYEVAGLGSTWFSSPADESDAGTASITWEFDPDPPLPPLSAEFEPPR
jgi:hypothetical protein